MTIFTCLRGTFHRQRLDVCKILCASLTRALLPYVYLLFIMSAACVLENGEIIFFLECFFLLSFPVLALFDHLSNIMKQAGRQEKKRKKKILAYSYFYFSFYIHFSFVAACIIWDDKILFFLFFMSNEKKRKKNFPTEA